MPLGTNRNKVLHGIGAKRGRAHRYTLIRWAVGIAFTAAIALLPLAGILRFDLWGGRHVLLGREVGFVEAAKAFAFPFLFVNVVIILLSRFVGRYLCGFVCPVGALARLAEWLRWREGRGASRWVRLTSLLGTCLVLAAVTFSFWIDWRVFLEGSPPAATVAGASLFALTGSLFLLLDRLGLRFCRDYCPSGVYFAVLGPNTLNGVEFAHPENCTECKACEMVCPMDLHPKELDSEETRPGMGFYPDGLSNYANCIRCGDCVVACEGATARLSAPTPLRMGWLPRSAGEEGAGAAAAPPDGREGGTEERPARCRTG